MRQTLIIKYIGDDKETQLPFEKLLEYDLAKGWLIMVDSGGKTIFVNTNNCKYCYFREEEKK